MVGVRVVIVSLWLGLDLGGTNTKAAVVDDDTWQLVETGQVATDRSSPARAVAALAQYGREWMHRFPGVVQVGVTVPGHFDSARDRATIVPNIPGDWTMQPFREPIERILGRPVVVINDARAFGLAESRLGAARGFADVLGIVLGTGVGGALILDGKLRLGNIGIAGEVGHQVLDPNGPACGCGNHGCLESLVKASSIAAEAGTPTVADAVAAARSGDSRALSAIQNAAVWLGIGIANVVNVMSPQVIVVGGGIAQADDVLFQPLVDELRRRTPLVPEGSFVVVKSMLGTAAGAVGAAVLASELPRCEEKDPVSMTQRDAT